MLNVLPQQQKMILKKEYSMRRVVICLALIICTLVISLILLIPSYFSFYLKAGQTKAELEQTKKILDTDLQAEELTAELSSAIAHAADLKPLVAPTSVYGLVRLFESKPATIKISNIFFVGGKAEEGSVISLKGNASDRESLKTFGRALEGRVEFQSVDLPVSNFVKETDIDFTMSLKVK